MKKNSNLIWIIAIVILVLLLAFLIINKAISKGNLVELTYDEFVQKIDNEESFVLCISLTTCSHCATYKPKLESVANDYGIDLYYIDIDKYSEEEQDEFEKIINFNDSTPTTVFLKNGKETTASNRINGDVSTSRIIDKLKSNDFID
mgnify:FL=1